MFFFIVLFLKRLFLSFSNKTLAYVLVLSFGLQSCAAGVTAGLSTSAYIIARNKTTAESYSDLEIFLAARNKLFAGEYKYLLYHIDLKVHNGAVYIVGNVKSDEHREFIIDSIKKIEGVNQIFDEMSVKEKIPFFDDLSTSFKDSILTLKAKINLAFVKNVKSINFSLETFEGTVYVVGNAQSSEELEKITEVVSKGIGVDKVVNYSVINSISK